MPYQEVVGTNSVDRYDVLVPHFGVALTWEQWEVLAEKLKAAETDFIIEPYIRLKVQVGEQATILFLNPCGNSLKFKAFEDMGQLFAK
tara:strand:- start:242 stop:505 length:264 start_codon:yes stop_codon:yes gene_type:complete